MYFGEATLTICCKGEINRFPIIGHPSPPNGRRNYLSNDRGSWQHFVLPNLNGTIENLSFPSTENSSAVLFHPKTKRDSSSVLGSYHRIGAQTLN